MANTYDFYKPKLDSEYPEVDGPVSMTAYISAIDASYKAFRNKHTKAKKASGSAGPAWYARAREDNRCGGGGFRPGGVGGGGGFG